MGAAGKYFQNPVYFEGISYGAEMNAVINLSNRWRRNRKKWSFTSYTGFGSQMYTSTLYAVEDDSQIIEYPKATSVFFDLGLGVKRRINSKIDIELRSTIYLNFEDHLDAAITEKQIYESFIQTNIGVVYKLGKNKKHAIWVNERTGSSKGSGSAQMVDPRQVKDSDGDGVVDMYDKEPNTPKKSFVYGNGVSVDSDHDGVPDYRDDCPFAAGPSENKGCPVGGAVESSYRGSGLKDVADSDGDGVADIYDKEPNTPEGVRVYGNGVAFDSDKDGVPDYKDRCPLVVGVVENDGCPVNEDLDGDGVFDNEDLCPDIVGLADNFGCPLETVTTGIEAQLKNLLSQIEFSRSEGHILRGDNLKVLSKVGDVMNHYKATSFTIEVHTTNKPDANYNLNLSKRRAYAINKYLTEKKKVSEDRLEVLGKGGEFPKYDTDDPEVNLKNDRVEIKFH